jgi:glyoxylase-like metal-dependent hydrolase (beta-lactamase superfamily II)/rhodanese-related sulfurtransferase
MLLGFIIMIAMEQENMSEVQLINADELKKKLEGRQPLILLDMGDRERYGRMHIPGSAYAIWSEEARKNIMPRLPRDVPVVLVSDDERHAREMASMMRNLGLDATYLQGGLNSWKWSFVEGQDEDISANELKELLDVGKEPYLLDVREPSEFADWNIKGSMNITLGTLSNEDQLKKIPKDKEVVTICPAGNRSMVAKFILSRHGYRVRSLEGGLTAWTTAYEYASDDYDVDGQRLGLIQVRRIGKGCLSYLIESGGEAAVIDPVFPVDDYIRVAKDLEVKITMVYDTHQHADHVSAARVLASETGAELYLSGYEGYAFKHNKLEGGDKHKIGAVVIKVIHTPGHTAGSLSLLLGNKLLITGDTLFVNGVGRPDLRENAEELAPVLYDTIHGKLLSLPEDVQIFPAHFDGLAKGGELITASLAELKENELLKLGKDEFVSKILSAVMPTPPHHKEIIAINKGAKERLSVSEIEALEMGPNRCSISI